MPVLNAVKPVAQPWVEGDWQVPGGLIGHQLVAGRLTFSDDEPEQRQGGPGRFRHLEPTPDELDRWDEEWRQEWDEDGLDDSPAYDPISNENFDPFLEHNWEEIDAELDHVPDEEDFWMPDEGE